MTKTAAAVVQTPAAKTANIRRQAAVYQMHGKHLPRSQQSQRRALLVAVVGMQAVILLIATHILVVVLIRVQVCMEGPWGLHHHHHMVTVVLLLITIVDHHHLIIIIKCLPCLTKEVTTVVQDPMVLTGHLRREWQDTTGRDMVFLMVTTWAALQCTIMECLLTQVLTLRVCRESMRTTLFPPTRANQAPVIANPSPIAPRAEPERSERSTVSTMDQVIIIITPITLIIIMTCPPPLIHFVGPTVLPVPVQQ